jgi:RHS repeat-associated protein
LPTTARGARVAQQVTISGVTTTTTDYLLGGLEEVTGGTTLTEYYPLPGIGTAVRVGSGSTSTLSYLASDQLGNVTVALSASGSVTAQQLYSPYGSVRYASGTMPSVTDHGYTGQIADATTGLSYYGARYYDPTLGQFTSADTTSAGGLNRYAYVGGNPETATDPSGLRPEDPSPTSTVSSVIQQAEEVAAAAWAAAEAAGAAISLAAVAGIGVAVVVIAVSAYLLYQNVTTPYPAHLPQYRGAVPVAAPTAQPQYPGPGSSQWTLPDNNYIRGAMATAALGMAAGAAAQQGTAGATTPKGGPTNPEPGPGTPPTPQTGSGGANGGAGVTPPTGSCGCWPDENGGGGDIWVSQKGLSILEAHLSGEFASPENDAMIARLRAALEAGVPISGADANFYLHEVSEATFMAQGLDYDTAHAAALTKYGVSPYSLYHPDVIQQLSQRFNDNWRRYWGLPCSE